MRNAIIQLVSDFTRIQQIVYEVINRYMFIIIIVYLVRLTQYNLYLSHVVCINIFRIDFQLLNDLACNAMETLLIHEDLMNGSFFADVCNLFKRENVKLNAGPKLNQSLTFGPPVAKSMRQEYGALEATIEIVKGALFSLNRFENEVNRGEMHFLIGFFSFHGKGLDEAIDHIHKYGSSHTDVIITENGKINCFA